MEKYHENGNKLAHVLLQTATLFNVNEIRKLIYTIENYCKTYKKYTITPIKTFRFIIILGNKMFSAFTVTE